MKNKKRKYNFLLFANILLVMITTLSALASNVDPRTFWLFSFFGLAFPFLILANVLFITWWFIKKLRYSLLSILCLVVFNKQLGNSFGFSLFSNNMEQVDSFKIMSYNTTNFRHQAKGKKAIIEKRKKAIEFIANDVNPDILCTQELAGTPKDNLLKKLKKHHLHQIPKRGALIFSKFPFVSTGEIYFSTNTNSCLWADVKINDDTIRIYSVHLQSNRISKYADNLLTEKTTKDDIGTVKRILSRYKKYNIRRARQADMIREHANNSPHPVVICGDLNDTPQSYTYKIVRSNMKDAFLEKGLGLGVSFGGKIPGLRIDYILPDKNIKVINYTRYKNDFSDHFPISSIMKIE